MNFGVYHVVDEQHGDVIEDHIDLEEHARRIGVLQNYEEMVA